MKEDERRGVWKYNRKVGVSRETEELSDKRLKDEWEGKRRGGADTMKEKKR